MGGHGPEGAGPSGVAGGMRRRPIDVTKKLPLIRSTKELELDDESKVDAEVCALTAARAREKNRAGRKSGDGPLAAPENTPSGPVVAD